MSTFDLFSKKQKRLRGEVPEVYQYSLMPKPLRVQIVQIIRDSFGKNKELYGKPSRPKSAYKFVHDTACREYGKFTLDESDYGFSNKDLVEEYILSENDIEKVLDIVDLAFKYINRIIRKNYRDYIFNTTIILSPDEALDELNVRFKEHGVGFQFENNEIIRLDSTYMHSEIVKPLLKLLVENDFTGSQDEYLGAHEHYRHGRNKECLNDCLKAFESTLKTICKIKKWAYKEQDTSKKLINICFQNNLVPSYTQNQFTSLRNLLESGIPTIRNKLGGHGQGQSPQKVDDEMVRYGLNLTGSNMIFLIEQSKL